MADTPLYTNSMLEALIAKMDAQIAKVDEQITALGLIKTTIGAGVQRLLTRSIATADTRVLTHAQKNIGANLAAQALTTIYPNCTGTFRLKIPIAQNGGQITVTPVGGGSATNAGGAATVAAPYESVVTTTAATTSINVTVTTYAGAGFIVSANTISVGYEMINYVEDGPFSAT